MSSTRISAYTKILNGKPVRVNGYTVNRDAAGAALRVPGRPFITATPGRFPNERGLPNIFPVEEIHSGSLDTAGAVQALRSRAEQQSAKAQDEFAPKLEEEKLPKVPEKVSQAELMAQLRRMEEMLSNSTVGTADKMRRLLQFLTAAENVMTAAEAAKTTSRALSKIRGK